MHTQAFLEHYLEYLVSPSILLTLLLVAPILWNVFRDSKSTAINRPVPLVAGCRRLGLPRGRSNLADQYESGSKRGSHVSPPSSPAVARVKALFTYPIKSARGVELSGSEVIGTGLRYDRLFAFAQLQSKQTTSDDSGTSEKGWQHTWKFITQREVPRLALLETELWVPDRRSTQRTPGHSRNTSEDSDYEGRSQSRPRKSTLALEGGGVASAKRRKFSMPELEENWVANGGYLIVRFPWEPDFNPFGFRTETVTLRIPLAPTPQRAERKGYTHEVLEIWKDFPLALNVTNEIGQVALQRLSYFLGLSKPLALFRVDDGNQRTVTKSLPDSMADGKVKIAFADGFPVNLLNIASVRAVDDSQPNKAVAKGKLDARRFRANIYIEGPAAYEEDNWQRVTVGHSVEPYADHDNRIVETVAEYHVACRTTRCTLPNVDPDTGIRDNNQPYTTLTKTRMVDPEAKKKAVLGVHMVPLFDHGIVRVGDSIDILERR